MQIVQALKNVRLQFLFLAPELDEPIFPIISAGLTGNEINNTGLGMSIFYNSKNELVGIIKTDQLQVVAKSKIEETTNENIHTYTLVWNNIQKSLSLHRNGNLLANGVKTKTSNDKKTIGRYEYISLYNSYTSTKSYTHGSFLQFSISFLSAPGMLTNNLQG